MLIGNEEISVTVIATTLDNPISFANSIGTLIVSDDLYDVIAEEISPETEVLSINGQSIKDNEALFLDLSEYLNDSPYLQGNSHRIHEIFSLSSSTFLLLGFLVILFFIATGSILYFNNLSAISDSKADYEILRKMGYTDRTVKKIIKKQTISFFSIPFLFGLVDCVFATLVYRTALMQNILKESLILYIPTFIAKAILDRDNYGHWEMDTVVSGRGGKGVLLVFTERRTREEEIYKINSKSMHDVTNCINQIEQAIGLKKFRQRYKTITCDNGVEFLDADGIVSSVHEDAKRTELYYCHPYRSCERGSNENANKLIRRWIPKGANISIYTDDYIKHVQEWINNYPRKLFNGLSSNQYRAELTL